MDDLANKKCVPCEGGIPAFDIKEIHKYLKKVDGWDVLEDKDKNFYIEKNFKFSNLQNSENYFKQSFCVPLYFGLKVSDVNYIIKKINSISQSMKL